MVRHCYTGRMRHNSRAMLPHWPPACAPLRAKHGSLLDQSASKYPARCHLITGHMPRSQASRLFCSLVAVARTSLAMVRCVTLFLTMLLMATGRFRGCRRGISGRPRWVDGAWTVECVRAYTRAPWRVTRRPAQVRWSCLMHSGCGCARF